MQVYWIASNGGGWSTASNWNTGTIPAAGDDVFISGLDPTLVTITGTVQAASLTEDYNATGPLNGEVLLDGSLELSGALTLTANADIHSAYGNSFYLQAGSSLTADSIKIGRGGLLIGLGINSQTETINADIDNDYLILAGSHTIIHGTVTGFGSMRAYDHDTLELDGTSNQAVVLQNGKFILGANGSFGGNIEVSGHSTVDFANASSFAPARVDFFSTSSAPAVLDFKGVIAASFSGSTLTITKTGGQTQNLTAYLWTEGGFNAQLPNDYALVTASDGNGGTLVSFEQGIVQHWKDGVSGDWSNGANWVAGFAPTAYDQVLIDGTQSSGINVTTSAAAESLTLSDSSAAIVVTGSLDVADTLTMAAGFVQIYGGGSVTAGSGIDIGQNALLYTAASGAYAHSYGYVIGDIVNNGRIDASNSGHLVITGDVTGSGFMSVDGFGAIDGGAILELDGSASQEIDLYNNATLKLDQAAHFSGTIFEVGNSTLDLSGASVFNGSINFFAGTSLDLKGVSTASFAFDGHHTLTLHQTNGQALDLSSFIFPIGYPSNFNPATYVPPSNYGFQVAGDGHGGTLISVVPSATQTWLTGDWSQPSSWASGHVPGTADSVVTSGTGVHSISAHVSAANLAVTTGSLLVGGSLTLSGGLDLQRSGKMYDGAVLSAGTGMQIGSSVDFEIAAATYNDPNPARMVGNIHSAGGIRVDNFAHLAIEGSIDGSGGILVDGTLEITGADTQTGISLLREGAKLILDDGQDVTAKIAAIQHTTIDLKSSTAFNGKLIVEYVGSTVDLVGITSASMTGHVMHVTNSAGASYDITTYFTPYNNLSVTDTDPDFSLVTSSDGHGGTLITFLSTIEHAPVAQDTSATVQAGGTISSVYGGGMPQIVLSASDQDFDNTTLASIQGPTGGPVNVPANNSVTIHGTYGDLYAGYGSVSYGQSGPLAGVAQGHHAVEHFTYTMTDGRGGYDSAAFDIVINRGPTAVNDIGSVSAQPGQVTVNAAHGVLKNDTDPDGDILQVAVVYDGFFNANSPSNTVHGQYGDLTLNWDGSYSYVLTGPAAVGAHDTFTYGLVDSYSYDPSANLNLFNGPTATLDIVIGVGQNQPPAEVPLTGTANGIFRTTEPDGSKVLARYDAAGKVLLIRVTETDGSDDLFNYTNGVPTKETQTHADHSKDVFLVNIAGKSYVAEHDTYNTAGVLTDVVRTHFDGTTDYTFNFDTVTGIKTTDQYDSSGATLLSRVLGYLDGSSETIKYASGTGLVSSDVFKFAPGSDDISDTKLYDASGLLSRETVLHADHSKDIYLTNVTGAAYVASHDVYDTTGVRTSTDRTFADGSHSQIALATGVSLTSHNGVTDRFTSNAAGGDTFVFTPGSGNDIIQGFHAGSASNHDILEIHGGTVGDFNAWAATHLHSKTVAGKVDVTVDVSATDHVTLKALTASLVASDFHFLV